jgi:adenine-specific DNA-methyltransferase
MKGITCTELVWAGKYDEQGNLRPVERTILPFQVVETVNESKADREKAQRDLFTLMPRDDTWRNMLIWGDNKVVMSSLLPRFAGKINLIYIDPPFATGQDFSFRVRVGDEEFVKEPSIIEEKAYRDTWGRGLDSYLQMMYERLVLMRELLAEDGSICVHIGTNVNHIIRMAMDEVFGPENFRNEIAVKRGAKSVQAQFETIDSLMYGYDTILLYTRNTDKRLPHLRKTLQDVRPGTWNNHWRGTDRPTMRYELFGIIPKSGQWRWSKERTLQAVKNYERYLSECANQMSIDEYYLSVLDTTGEKLDFVRLSQTGKPEHYVPPSATQLLNDVWLDISAYERTDFPTQKSEDLLTRIVSWLSNEGDLVADFFCGSGTTLAVAEKLGRRWIGCDLSKWAIQVTRKRLLQIEGCKPFEILNLGNYERHKLAANGHWERYVQFILQLYRAEPVTGFATLHGKKARAYVHVGSVDSPVTMREIRQTLKEAQGAGVREVHFLGWDFEMGLHDLVSQVGDDYGVKVRLVSIPREALEVTNPAKEEVRFFDLNYLELEHALTPVPSPSGRGEKGVRVTVRLKDFIIANPEYIPDEVREKITKFTDYIDYWAVDWDYKDDTFHNGWQSFRTRKEPKLETQATHTYEQPGTYKVLVKVVDIFGNDTTKMVEIQIQG